MGGFSPQGAGGGATADQIWSYATRTLTQTKFPFWSAIITQTYGSASVAAASSAAVTITPPSGETWLIWLDFVFMMPTSGCYVEYDDYNPSTGGYNKHRLQETGGAYGDRRPHLGVLKVLTSSLGARIGVYNADTAGSAYLFYGYSGFKLSQPLWTPKRLNDPPAQPWKKPTSLSLPSPLAPLQKYAAEILGLDPAKPNDYALGVILEEDTPLAVDEKTGFPVERLTVVVKADVLADYIAKFKAKTADPVATGYRKYLDKWRAENINLGI